MLNGVEGFPVQIWSNLVARHSRTMDAKSFHYGELMGSKHLRETIATYLRTARSLRCEAEQIMIVSGSQQALEISALCLLDPGSRVWVEDPGYRFAQDAFALAGCDLVPVPVDEEGLDISIGIEKCRKARAVFVRPPISFRSG
jgi:GntR family transcriptional regulator/MocR family aminotransferase